MLGTHLLHGVVDSSLHGVEVGVRKGASSGSEIRELFLLLSGELQRIE